MKYTDILVQIRQIVRSINLESKRIEKEYGISIPQLLCLNFLSGKETFQASHKEIKDFLKLNASTVTGIISRLESKGLVARLPKRNDKRVGLIAITANGVKMLDDTPEPLHQQLSSKLKQLSPEALIKLQNSFETIIDFLNIENIEAAPIITAESNLPKKES
ncbi:MAG: MarR family winged helix-turn-helix transcriptional regulator [Saprospiraceae bacterium]